MNRYPEKSAYFRVGVAAALSAVAINAGIDQTAAQTNEAAPSPPNSAETGTNERTVVNIGNFAVATAASDKYATKNLPPTLKRIGGCESNGSPHAKIDYKAKNPRSTATGGFQFLYGTWNHFMGYKEARMAPHRVQNKKAIITYHKYGTSPWVSSRGCWG